MVDQEQLIRSFSCRQNPVQKSTIRIHKDKKMKSQFKGKFLCAAVVSAAIFALSNTFAVAQTAAPAPSTNSKTPPKTAKPEPKAAPGQYKSEAEAKSGCAGDTVVWGNLKSKKYHASGTRDYGKTSKGAYMCEKSASAGGFKAVKSAKKTVN